MTSEDAVPDRERLRHVAAQRTRRSWWVVAALAAALFLLPLTLLIADGGPFSAGEIVVAFIPPTVAVLIGVVGLRRMRRREGGPELLAGADRGTRRAVQRALRTGRAPDARIDALAREAADRTLRNSWLIVVYAILLVVQLGLLIGRIVAADDLGRTILAAATSVCWAAVLGLWLVMRARSRRYLEGAAHVEPQA